MNIDYSIYQNALDNGYHLDMLGQPVKVGDVLLVKGYGSKGINCKAVVKRLTPKVAIVDITYTQIYWGRYDPTTRTHPGFKQTTVTKEMRRAVCDTLKVNDFYDQATKAYEDFINEHPELAI